MKVSLKFRDDRRPLARAKIPISVIGIPFVAGASAGEALDLRLDLTTAFASGPAFRVCYRPNEPSNPFSLAIKTGIGAFGSPVAAPMSMITEFNLLPSWGGSGCPAFSVIFKPCFGDFCFRKAAYSPSFLSLPLKKKIVPDEGMFPPPSPMQVHSRKFIPDEEIFPPPPTANGFHTTEEANGVDTNFPVAQGGIGGLVSGIDVTARSVLPLSSRAEVGFRWGLRMPTELPSSFSAATFSMPNLPMLVMNKISIELIPAATRAKPVEINGPVVSSCEVVEACKSVRRDLAVLRDESVTLRKVMEDIRDSIHDCISATRKASPAMVNKNSSDTEVTKDGWRKMVPEPVKKERQNELKLAPDDVNKELKKSLMAAHSTTK